MRAPGAGAAEAAGAGGIGAGAATLGTGLAAAAPILLLPTNTQRETSQQPVAGHPDRSARRDRAPGDLSGTVTLHGPVGPAGHDTDLLTLHMDPHGTLTAPGNSTKLDQADPFSAGGVTLTPAGEGLLADRTEAAQQDTAQRRCRPSGPQNTGEEAAGSAETAGLPPALQSDFQCPSGNFLSRWNRL